MALSSDELERLEQFRDELGIDGDAKAQPDELLQRALGELEIAGGATARESFLLVEAEMRRSAELRAQAAALHSAGATEEDFEDFEDADDHQEAQAPQTAAAQGARQQPSFSSESLLAAHGPTNRPRAEKGDDSKWGSWIGKAATEYAGVIASAARGDGGGRVVVNEPVDDSGPGAVCAQAEDGTLVVTYLKQGAIGVAFDPPTWPRLLKIEQNSLSTDLKELQAGLILHQIEGIDVARLPMADAFAIFARAGRPVTLTFGAPQPDVVATFEGDGPLGLSFKKNSANPLNVAKVGPEGLATKLPQLKEDLLLTHVNGACVAGVKPEYDGVLAQIRDAGRPMTLTFTPLPPDRRPKPTKDEAEGIFNLEPMKLDNEDDGSPHIHEGWLEKNRPKGLRLIWQKRYFVLYEDTLSYYQNPPGSTTQGDNVKRGEIPLSTVCTVSALDDTTFDIAVADPDSQKPVEPSREPYKLRAENADIASQWLGKIKQACEKVAAEAKESGLRVTWSNCEAAMEELAAQEKGADADTGATESAPARDHRSNVLANEWTPSPRSTPGGSSDSGGFSPASAMDDSVNIVIDDGDASSAKLRTIALNGALPVLRALVENIARRADGGTAMLNEAGTDGQTALHIAAQHGHDKVVAALLDAGAQVNVVNAVTGRTPLHVSCVAGHAACAAQLLEARADEMLPDRRGRTALEAARRAKQQAVLDLPGWSAEAVAAANLNSPARRLSPRASTSPRNAMNTSAASSESSPASGSAASRLARLEALSSAAGAAQPAPALIATTDADEGAATDDEEV